MTRQAANTAAGPVQGPARPTPADLIWATASSQAALDDPSLSAAERLSYLEAEAATYTAAAHLGVNGAAADHYGAELEHHDLAPSTVESTPGTPELGERAAVPGAGVAAREEAEATEPEAGL